MQTSTGLSQTQSSLSELYSSVDTISTFSDTTACLSDENEWIDTDTDMDEHANVGNDCTSYINCSMVHMCTHSCTCWHYHIVCRMMLCTLTDCFRDISLTFLALQTIWRALLVATETKIHQKPLSVMLNSFSNPHHPHLTAILRDYSINQI